MATASNVVGLQEIANGYRLLTSDDAKPTGTTVPAAGFIAAGTTTYQGRPVWAWDVSLAVADRYRLTTTPGGQQSVTVAAPSGPGTHVPVVATAPSPGLTSTLPPGRVVVTQGASANGVWDETPEGAQLNTGYEATRGAFQTVLPGVRGQLQLQAKRPIGG